MHLLMTIIAVRLREYARFLLKDITYLASIPTPFHTLVSYSRHPSYGIFYRTIGAGIRKNNLSRF